MQDEPHPTEILAGVAALMRDTLMPQLSGHTAYLVRVAANAIDLVRRQIELEPSANDAEQTRLRALLNEDGDLESLNARLVENIERGVLNAETPGLKAHLWATTLEKLAIDQPTYAAYQRALKTPLTK